MPLDTLFVYLSEERMDVYPQALVSDVLREDGRMVVTTIDGRRHPYDLSFVESISSYAPDSLPCFTLFKFNNKYNDQLFTDVVADIEGDSVIRASIGAIGKWLTPSFHVSDSLAQAFVDNIRQDSKHARQNFGREVRYTVARPGWQVLDHSATGDSLVWHPYGHIYKVRIDWLSDHATAMPTLRLVTDDGTLPSSKTTYVDATMSIDGGGVWPNLPEVALQIKGRGNTSWSSDPLAKNPYRLKFPSGLKPFGLTRGKNWVLQANAQTGSMMTNAIGMKAAHLMGCAAANHVVPVELYMNDRYRGSYVFTEKIGFHNNSIELDDVSRAYLLELDTYSDPTKFRTDAYYMPVNIKEPEADDNPPTTTLTRQAIIDDVNDFMRAVYEGEDITGRVDVEHLAAYLSLNELIGNYEIMHPKSVYLYKEDLAAASPFVFGPVWDLDWAYGYASRRAYYLTGYTDDFYKSPTHTYSGGTNAQGADDFWKRLRYGSETIDRACYVLWTRFVKQGGLDELLDYVDAYYEFANPSFTHNSTMWSDGKDYATLARQAKTWLQRRAANIYARLTPYDLTNEERNEPVRWKPYTTSTDDIPSGIFTINPQPSSFNPQHFDVYTLQGVCLKRHATFDTWREGLVRGIYLVNGRRVMIP